MNILERWKIAKDGEICFSRQDYAFRKREEYGFLRSMDAAKMPEGGFFDEWSIPKKKRVKIVTNVTFRKARDLSFHIDSSELFFTQENLEGKVFSTVTFEWEE